MKKPPLLAAACLACSWSSAWANPNLLADSTFAQPTTITAPATVSRDFSASPGDKFIVRGTLTQGAGDEALDANRIAAVRVEFEDADGQLQSTEIARLSGDKSNRAPINFDKVVVAPANATQARMVLRVEGGASGTATFDNLTILRDNTLEWWDDFDGTALDTSKWIIVHQVDWSQNGETCWYAPHNVEVSDGSLKLHSAQESYNGGQWTGAKLESRYHPQYKYLEARLRHSAPDTKIWATWWTVGWRNNTWQWPPEMDICEFGTQWEANPSQTYHWDIGNGHQYDGDNTGVDETEWHTYGAYWSDTTSPIFYVDGLISYAPGGPVEGNLMAALLILSSSPNRDDHYNGCPLAEWEVDYVRVYDAAPEQPEEPTHLAKGKPAVASSAENSGLGADKAVDGLETSRWASNWTASEWLRVDLEGQYAIDEVKIYWQYASAREYKIQVADNTNGPWTDCTHITNNWDHEAWKTHTFAPQTGRYIRLLCMQRTTEWGYSVFEFEVYGDAAPNFPFDDDGDGDIDLADFANFLTCADASGPGATLTSPCENHDADADGDVDLADFATFQQLYGD